MNPIALKDAQLYPLPNLPVIRYNLWQNVPFYEQVTARLCVLIMHIGAKIKFNRFLPDCLLGTEPSGRGPRLAAGFAAEGEHNTTSVSAGLISLSATVSEMRATTCTCGFSGPAER